MALTLLPLRTASDPDWSTGRGLEDARYAGATLEELQTVAPGIGT
jgi:hypothetical protein